MPKEKKRDNWNNPNPPHNVQDQLRSRKGWDCIVACQLIPVVGQSTKTTTLHYPRISVLEFFFILIQHNLLKSTLLGLSVCMCDCGWMSTFFLYGFWVTRSELAWENLSFPLLQLHFPHSLMSWYKSRCLLAFVPLPEGWLWVEMESSFVTLSKCLRSTVYPTLMVLCNTSPTLNLHSLSIEFSPDIDLEMYKYSYGARQELG